MTHDSKEIEVLVNECLRESFDDHFGKVGEGVPCAQPVPRPPLPAKPRPDDRTVALNTLKYAPNRHDRKRATRVAKGATK